MKTKIKYSPGDRVLVGPSKAPRTIVGPIADIEGGYRVDLPVDGTPVQVSWGFMRYRPLPPGPLPKRVALPSLEWAAERRKRISRARKKRNRRLRSMVTLFAGMTD